ncbi:MAG TPA: ABC transporter ATP-binding protein [Gaiellaceae bacterium]|jgi:lipopolysaccharide transport system ATP-binding protein
MKTAVVLDGIGKKYRIGTPTRFPRMTEALTNAARRGFRRPERSAQEIWVLRDVSFEVTEGEVVGIIGRNGAGKSTLLKILSRITAPTEGEAWIAGHVASLLEVGTGFHPDLTGRENVYLNGAILGMHRQEIKQKFDEIVAFAEVEQFLDTPVKFYSSGMYVRLAFAVAAHLEPHVLIVDEVLAVGDIAFQRKCLGKMGEVARSGRTVLFVSHNIAAIQSLCNRGVVLDRGRVTFVGSNTDAVVNYLATLNVPSLELANRLDRTGSGEIRVTGVEIRDEHSNLLTVAVSGQTIDVVLHFERTGEVAPQRVVASIGVKTEFDSPVFIQHNRLGGLVFDEIPAHGAFVCRLPSLALSPGAYRLTYELTEGGRRIDRIEDAASLTVVAGDYFGTPEVPGSEHGPMLMPAEWRLEPVGAHAVAEPAQPV